jgi:hypothetical protein
LTTPGRWEQEETHRFASGDCAKLPQAGRPFPGGVRGVTGVRMVAVVMVGGRSLVVAVGACEN